MNLKNTIQETIFDSVEDAIFAIKNGEMVIVADDEACYQLMQKFIAESPELWNEDIGV